GGGAGGGGGGPRGRAPGGPVPGGVVGGPGGAGRGAGPGVGAGEALGGPGVCPAPPPPAPAGPAAPPGPPGGGRAVLELAAVTKVYPSAPPVTALRGVDLTVAAGELVAVVGPSGSGKSTLLHLMGTLDRPSSGTLLVTGLDVAALADKDLAALRATSIGFVFQQYFLAEHQTVLDNVADGLLYAGTGPAERRARARDALALVGLAARPGARPTQLSGG